MIYSNLDTVFLDEHTHSYRESLPALRAALAKAITVIFCSKRTRAEIAALLSELGICLPFIAEDGGGVFIPEGYFRKGMQDFPLEGSWRLIPLGVPHHRVLRALAEVAEETGVDVRGLSEMSPEEAAGVYGLSLRAAWRTLQRRFDEPVVIGDESEGQIDRIRAALEIRGLRLLRGEKLMHVNGACDMGLAIRQLNARFLNNYESIYTMGIGDSVDDIPILSLADLPVLVAKISSGYDESVVARLPDVRLAPGAGPSGWSLAVSEFASQVTAVK